MRLTNAFLLVAVLIGVPGRSALASQSQKVGNIDGTVSDTLGNLLADVQVGLVGTPHYAVTDDKGVFHLPKVPTGSYTIAMRRLGFSPITMAFAVTDTRNQVVDFELTQNAVRLAPLSIKAEHISAQLKRVGFESRLRTAGVAPSHFVTRQELEAKHVQLLSHVIDRLGSRAHACDNPNVFLDGIPFTTFAGVASTAVQPNAPTLSGRARSPREDNSGFQNNKPLDFFQVRNIEGMEVYSSASEVPAEFKAGPGGNMNSKCVIVLWTRDR